MTATTELLCGELEKHFDLEGLTRLSTELLGLDPADVGNTSAKGAFARALVERCGREDALEALVDALLISAPGADARVKQVYAGALDEELAPGAQLAGYRVVKKLGEGGLGVVYLGERKDGDATLRAAIKVVRGQFARDRAAVQRFLTVSRVLKTVKCGTLAPVLDVGKLADGRPWVASQYVDGQTLSARVARVGPMHFNEARPVLKGVLDALEELHGKGLVHGDVKAENVFVVRLVSADGAKTSLGGVLMDGGTDRLLARAPCAADKTGVLPLFGTAKAMSPEQAHGAPLDARSDVYAFGALLFEVLSGKAPFSGKSAIDVVVKHLSEPAPAASSVAPRGWVAKELDEIVARALAKDPAERYSSAAAIREAMDALARQSMRPPAEKTTFDTKEFDAAKELLLLEPGNEELAVALERIAGPAHEWEKALAALDEAVSKTEDAEAKKGLLFRVARIEEHERKDLGRAEAAYLRLLEVDPEDEIAQIGVEELRRHSGNIEGLVELLLEKVARAEEGRERASVLHEIAGLYEEKLSQPDNAFVAWVQALAEDPADDKTVREIERIAGSNADRWNEAMTTLNESLTEGGDPAVTTRLFTLMGGWYADKLQRPDFALPCYSKALEHDPANEAALDGTIALYKKAQAWPDLVTILLRRADASASPAKGRDTRVEAAEVIGSKLNDASRATDLYKAVLAEDPVHPKASAALEDVFARSKNWAELVALLDQKAKSQRGEEKVETLCSIAELYDDRLTDAAKAQLRFEEALAVEPRHLGALKGLERLYARVGKYQELMLNLRVQIELAATPRQRIALLERIGGMQEEEFVDHEKAAATFEEIVAIDPSHDAANAALARLYRHLHRFGDLANALDRHAKGSTDDQRKIELLLQAVKVLMVDVGAPDRALATCERVLAIDPAHAHTLELVSRLHAQTGDASAALASVKKLAENERDPQKKAELYCRAGKLLEEAGDKDRAIAKYKSALDADSKSLVAFGALRAIYADRGDAHGAADLLEREISATDGPIAKAKLWAELGAMARERLSDRPKAREAFTKSLELDPTSTPAARGLGEMSFADGNFPATTKYLEPLLARTSEMDPKSARDLSVMCGDAFRKQSIFDKAQRAYLNAKAFASSDREVLERVADVTFESGAADEAAELYRDILERFGPDLSGGDKGRTYYRIGEAARRSDDLDGAAKALSEAADLLPGDPQPLEALVKVYEAQSKWEDLVRILRRRMEHAGDDERYQLLVRIGDISLEKQGDKGKAQKSYVAALELKGDDRNLLTKLMAIYSESKDWGRLVEVVLRIAELVTDKRQLAKYYSTAAAISSTELKRHEEAADYYEQALENDKSAPRAFEGLVSCVTELKDWNRLEEVYRGQLRRLEDGGTAEAKAAVWDALAEVLHHRLDRMSQAVEAYEEAQKLDSENRRRAETLSEIYASDPKRFYSKAVHQHAALLEKSPYRVESYQALRKLYTDVKRADESWCVCQALRALKQAEPDEEAFFKKHRSRQPAVAQERLDDELWLKHIVHADQDALLTGIFATMTPAAIAMRSQPLQGFGVDPTKKRNAAQDPAVMAQMLHYASGVIDIPLPDVYYREQDPGGLSFLFSQPPSIGLGKGALAGGPQQALAFVAGRHLSFFRGGHYLRHLVPTGGGLRAWLLAAIKSATPQFPIPPDLDAQVAEHLAAFKQHLTPPQQEHLKSLVAKLLAAAPELNLKRWVAAVDLTADRIGFVLANDLELALAVIQASPEDGAAVAQKDRLKELYLYAVSEPYMSLRYKLGINIGE
jgi:tetratricopeptide (TPR) repeat protein